LVDSDDDVSGDTKACCCLDDRFRGGGFVEAVGLLLVGGEERVQPADSDVVVDQPDSGIVEGVGVELIDEIPFDDDESQGISFVFVS
jgi:hypothetical protein